LNEFRSINRVGPLIDRNGEELTFARFYHLRAVHWRWTEHGHTGNPIGGWGYLFLGLGVFGFALGGVIAPAVLMKVPYCEQCELYMKTLTLALVPASVRARRVSKKDAAAQTAYRQEQDGAATSAHSLLSQVTGLAARGDALGIRSALASHPARGSQARAAGRLPARLRFSLVRCRQCTAGWLQPAMITGQGRGIRVSALDRVTMPEGTARMITET